MTTTADVHVRVSVPDKQRLRAQASAKRTTISEYLRELIDESLQRRFDSALEPVARRGRPRRTQ